MYQLGLKPKQRSRWRLWLGLSLIVLALVSGLVYLGLRSLSPKTTITQSKAVTTKVTSTSEALKLFDTPGFSLELPASWKEVTQIDEPFGVKRFQADMKATASRTIAVYQNAIPPNFAVNRVVALEANGDRVQINGVISDNCVDFTKGPSRPGTTGTLAKWQTVEFLCDLDNYQRNMVGTSSLGGINSVTVKNGLGASHKFFFVYVDNTISPNYTNFYTALTTFRTK